MTFVRYIGIDLQFGLLVGVRYLGDSLILGFVISGFCSIHFTLTLAGLRKIVRYTGDFVKSGSTAGLYGGGYLQTS